MIEWKNCFRVAVSVFALYLCIHFWPSVVGIIGAVIGAASPLIIGCVIAYIVNILMSMYERHYFPKSTKRIVTRTRRAVCMIAAFITVIAIICIVIGLVVPEFISCIMLMVAELPKAIKAMLDFMAEWDILPEDILATLSAIDWQSRISQIINVLTSGIGSVMDVVITTVSSVFSGIVTGFIGIIFSIYLLIGKDRLANQFKRIMARYMKENVYHKTMHILSIVNDCFHRYIVGQCTEAVILGMLCTLGMMMLRLPYASMIGALIALTALIPVAGAYIGGIVGALMILTVSPIKAIIFVVFLVILQQIEGNLIYPRVVGSSMGLPGVWVLTAVTIGGGIMGIAGMLLGVPCAAAVYRLLREDVNKGPRVAVAGGAGGNDMNVSEVSEGADDIVSSGAAESSEVTVNLEVTSQSEQ